MSAIVLDQKFGSTKRIDLPDGTTGKPPAVTLVWMSGGVHFASGITLPVAAGQTIFSLADCEYKLSPSRLKLKRVIESVCPCNTLISSPVDASQIWIWLLLPELATRVLSTLSAKRSLQKESLFRGFASLPSTAFLILTARSWLPEMSLVPSELKIRDNTKLVCPFSVIISLAELEFQTVIVLSRLPEAILPSSGLKSRPVTASSMPGECLDLAARYRIIDIYPSICAFRSEPFTVRAERAPHACERN